MGAIRTLYTDLKLRAVEATKGLVAYEKLWKQVAKSVDASAELVERAADRAGAAMARVAAGSMAVRATAGGTSRGGGGSARGTNPTADVARRQREAVRAAERTSRDAARQSARDDKENALIEARMAKQAAKASLPSGGRRGGGGSGSGGDVLDRAIASANRSETSKARAGNQATARMEGLAAGARDVRDATAALGAFATRSDRARAAVDDLTSKVARNRREMADLRAEAVRTGDADKTLAGRIQGLSVETLRANVSLAAARRELRAVDGGLIDAIKNTGRASLGFGALSSALGNMASNAASRVWHGIAGGIVDATTAATKFETGLTSISKVARGADDTEEGFARIKAGIISTSTSLGVLPTEVAELTAQLAPAFSNVSEGVDGAKVDLIALTAEVTKVGVAWDIPAKKAGETFAEISAGLKLTTADTKSLFGGINELGNQLGTKAADVAEAVQRSAGVLKGASISGETGAALSATLIKTGASAEIAATGVRTFITRLGAGETKGQLKAFATLGLDMKNLRKEMANGDAEGQIKRVVDALGGLKNEDRLAVLTELFGTESIGSIGAAATASDLLAQSFSIMGDKAASATSVQKEFDRVSKTSAAKVATLKANIEVLAISFGEALLPHINKVADFLTSPAGQEWGRGAVEKAVVAVTTLASAIGSVVGFFSRLSEGVGTANVAFGAMGLALVAMTGPFGLVLAGATALGAYLGQMFVDWMGESAELTLQVQSNMADVATSLANVQGAFGTTSSILVQMGDRVDAAGRQWAEWMLKIVGTTAALDEFYAKDAARRGVKIEAGRANEDKARRAARDGSAKAYAARTKAAGEADAGRRATNAGAPEPGGGASAGDEARFEGYSARVRRGEKLRPSEAGDYKRLSKKLDEATATKAGKGHKATKMDKRLAAIDPSLAGVLRRGGDEDAGGDLKVSDDPLSKAIYNRQAKAAGESGLGGGGMSNATGPNTTNHYTTIDARAFVTLDARSSATIPENIRGASNDFATAAGQVRITGVQKLIAARNGGGVLAG